MITVINYCGNLVIVAWKHAQSVTPSHYNVRTCALRLGYAYFNMRDLWMNDNIY